jgi:hypothetical protein
MIASWGHFTELKCDERSAHRQAPASYLRWRLSTASQGIAPQCSFKIERQVPVVPITSKTIRLPFNRMTNAGVCRACDQTLLFGVRTNYRETKCPQKKFIPVYYFFWGQKRKRKSDISALFY